MARLLEPGDVAGLALVAAAVIWTFVAATSAGDPWPVAGMFLLVATAYALGRLGSRTSPILVPALVVGVAVLLILLRLAGALPRGADAAPLGYVNARSAFFVEAAAAAVMVALVVRARTGKLFSLIVAASLGAVPLFSRSAAATFVVVLLPAAGAMALGGRRHTIAIAVSAVMTMAAIASTTLVAAVPEDSTLARLTGDVVAPRRVDLWQDGLGLMLEDPLTGVGPGRFAAEADTAQTDFDARWAHHGFLQQGAETGLIGMALLVLLFLWGFWRLAAAPPSGMAAMGAFALGGLGILACSDYVFHFPLVTAVTAGLLGAAVASPPTRPRGRSSRWTGGRTQAIVDAGLSRSPLQSIFQWRAERKLSVLAYHRIDEPEQFGEHLAHLRGNTHPVALGQVLDAIERRTGLPPRAVLVTFDDGDRTVLDMALPALRSAGIPGVAFVVAGLLDGDQPYWWEEVEVLLRAGATLPEMDGQEPSNAVRALKEVPNERRLLMIEDLRRQRPGLGVRDSQLRKTDLALLERGGVAIGNHSLTHPCLGRCSDAQVRMEIEEAHEIIRSALGHDPQAFAYPDGDWDPRAAELLRVLGYRAGFLFDHRAATMPVEDPLRISRLRVNAGTSMARFRTILSGLHPAIHNLRTRATTGGRG